MREQFKQAKADGDNQSAEIARAKGKALAQAIQNELELLKSTIEAEITNMADAALRSCKNENNDLSTLWGNTDGQGFHAQDLETKKELASKLQNNKALKQVAKQLGSLKKFGQIENALKDHEQTTKQLTVPVLVTILRRLSP